MAIQPLVSVLMSVYNGEKYLKEAIDSVLMQTYANLELVLLDDCSTDSSLEIIHSYTDSRIRFFQNDENLGIVKTLNKMPKLAQGKFVAIIDCDDVMYPQKIERQIQYLLDNPNCGVCGTWTQKISAKGRHIGKIQLPVRSDDAKINLCFQSSFVHSSVMMRKEILLQEMYDENFSTAQDFDLWTRLAERTDFYNAPQMLTGYRWHENNASKTQQSTQEAKREELIRRQLSKLGDFVDADVKNIIAIGNLLERNPEDYEEMSQSLKNLAEANKKSKKFIQYKLLAFLWYRWIFYCVYTKKYAKILQLKLPLWKVKTLSHLLVLLGQKAKGIFL